MPSRRLRSFEESTRLLTSIVKKCTDLQPVIACPSLTSLRGRVLVWENTSSSALFSFFQSSPFHTRPTAPSNVILCNSVPRELGKMYLWTQPGCWASSSGYGQIKGDIVEDQWKNRSRGESPCSEDTWGYACVEGQGAGSHKKICWRGR